MDFRDYLSIIFRHYKLALLMFSLTICVYFGFFHSAPPERYAADIELNISIAELTIQTAPDRFMIPNYTNQQLLQVIMRSDRYYNELAARTATALPAFAGDGGGKRMRRHIKYDFDGGSPNQQITTLKLHVESPSQDETELIMKNAVAVFRENIDREAQTKTQNELESVQRVRDKVETNFQDKLKVLQRTREEQQSNSVDVQLNASQAQLVSLTGRLSEQRYRIEDLNRQEKEIEARLTEGNWSDMADEDIEVGRWRGVIQDLRYEYNTMVRERAEGHPEVAALEAKLMEAERSLREALYTSNNRMQDIQQKRRRELREEIEFTRTTVASLEAERDRLLQDVKTLVDKKNAVDKLESETAEIQKTITELQRYETSLNVKRGQKELFVHTVSESQAYAVTDLGAPLQKFMLLLVVAMVVATFAVYIRELLSVDVENEQDIRRYLNLPVIVRIPRLKRGDETILTKLSGTEWFAELFKNLALIVSGNMNQNKFNVIEITSTGQQEGKSTIAINLAVSLARLEHTVLLLDCDLRAPATHQMLGLQREGIAEYVRACQEQDRFLDAHPFVQNLPSVPNLDIMAAGKNVTNPIQVLRNAYFRQMVATMRDQYDYVVIDTPPVSYAAEGLLLAELADSLYMVVAQSETNKKMAQEAVNIVRNAGAEINGILFNKSRHHLLGGAYYYSYYRSYYYGRHKR